MEGKNLFERFMLAKMAVQEANIKPSGVNKFSGYTYYELADILPVIIPELAKQRLVSMATYDSDTAYLKIYSVDDPSVPIVFTSPMSRAELKECHEVQNLGAVETYERRYLYMTAFDITDGDMLDPFTSDDEYYCDDCGKKIDAAAKKNSSGDEVLLTPNEIAKKSKKDFRRVLCIRCYQAAAKSLDEKSKRINKEK